MKSENCREARGRGVSASQLRLLFLLSREGAGVGGGGAGAGVGGGGEGAGEGGEGEGAGEVEEGRRCREE